MFDNIEDEIMDDAEYLTIVNPILENKEFQRIGGCIHHGTIRLYHLMRVSYYSYKIARRLNLDYESTARGGIMHDFFYNENGGATIDGIKSTFTHNKIAVENSEKYVGLNFKEKDIIYKHMFPLTLKLPRYKESYIVSMVDKVVGTVEFCKKLKLNVKLSSLTVLMNFIIFYRG